MDERRRGVRRPLLLECNYSRDSRITDLSATGCFVDSSRVPDVGEQVEFTVELDGAPVILRGTVVHAKARLGFAITFTDLSDEAAESVRAFTVGQEAEG